MGALPSPKYRAFNPNGSDFTADSRFNFQTAKDNSVAGPSFRDGPQDQTRNLEIPGSMLRIAPE
jgi:hypothetical protein